MPINDPTDITGLVFWGDAVVITENPSGLAQVMDNQEGTATEDLDQSVEGDRPSIVTVFGKQGLRFDRDDFDHLDGGGAAARFGVGTLVMVLRLPPASSNNEIAWLGDFTTSAVAVAVWKTNADLVAAGRSSLSSPAVTISPDVDWTHGDDVMLTLTWNSATNAMVIRINKVEKDSGIGGSFDGMDGMSLAARSDGLAAGDVTIYGVVAYDSILTGTDLTDIEEFMTDNYLPVNVLTSDAGPDQTVVADESDLGLVILDGTDSFGPLVITNYEWSEGAVILQSGPSPILITQLSVAVHTLTLTVTDTNLDTDADTAQITVDAFVPPASPTIRTFKEITSSTDTVHTFSDVFPLTPRLILLPFTEFHNQLRVFKKVVAGTVTELFPVGRPSSAGITDFSINTAGTQITLDVALISSDILLIMRDTTMFHPFITFIGSSKFHGIDRNVQGDQILFICQELREIRAIADILGSDIGEPFEYGPSPIDDSNWTKAFVGDGSTTAFLYSSIEMIPPTAIQQDNQLLVLVDNVLQTIVTDYTIDTVAFTVDFVSAPAVDEVIEIVRQTRIDKRWVAFRDGTTFSSLQDIWDFLNVKFIIEETPGFPAFVIPNALSNRIFPRALNTIQYSGPGDRFFFGNLAWFGDGTIFIFRNDLLLVDGVDYTIDFNFFFINLTIPLGVGDTLDIFTTTPNNAFGRLSWGVPGGKENSDTEDSEEPEGVESQGIRNAWLVNATPDTNIDEPSLSLIFVRPSGGVTFPLPHYISVIQFDVADIDPTDFSEVRLSFVLLGKIQDSDANILIRRSLRKWVIPEEITWNEWKDGELWTVAGAQGVDTDFDSASEITWSTTGPAPAIESVWLTPDLSALITAARADDNILRLIFFPDDPVGLWTVGSIDNPFVDNQPRLITYL